MTTGLLLIDVDGPLNPWAAKPSRRPDRYTTHRLRPTGWENARKPLQVWLRPDHGRLLLDLAAETGLELAWATTWQHDANRLIGPIVGLPDLPVVIFDRNPGTVRGWKYPAVLEFAAGRPVAWLDDDFDVTAHGEARAKFEVDRDGAPTLLRLVSPRIGLTEDDLIAVHEWAATLSGSQ